MDYLLVRFGEIGTKSSYVRSKMVDVLRQRVEDCLDYEEADYSSVRHDSGRIVAEVDSAEKIAENVAELPGVKTVSPAWRTQLEQDFNGIKQVIQELDFTGKTFGVRCRRAGKHDFDSPEVERKLGAFIANKKGLEVDLENPDTWVRIEIRDNSVYVYSKKIEGPGGFPVGTQDSLAALVSGGIDSPVAAYEVMARGSDITPIYFYNKPISAEDHLMRFEQVISEMKKFHPSKNWEYYVVDMEEINEELMKVEKGRMVLHRVIMFQIAERIAENEGLKGIVTGESLGQKSTQTVVNLKLTSSKTNLPIHRPLLTRNKNDITEKSRYLGFFEYAEINSACQTLAPEEPSTALNEEKYSDLADEVDIDKLVEKGVSKARKERI